MKYPRLLLAAGFVVMTVCGSHAVAAGGGLDDATIFAIFDQANATDIYIGRMGAKRGHSAAVRELGKMVANDHVAVQQMGRDLARKLHILPTPSDHDTSVADQAKTISLLQSKSGVAFDKAYLEHELGFHQSVINAIETTLLPAIEHEEFRTLVKQVLPGFKKHLAETKAVAGRLGIGTQE